MHKRRRIMAEDDSGLPFACLPGMTHHALTYSELPAQPRDLASMPFVHAQLPGGDEAERTSSQSAEASRAEAGQSGRLSPSAHAVDSDNYAVHSYPDADKEVHCLPALHSACRALNPQPEEGIPALLPRDDRGTSSCVDITCQPCPAVSVPLATTWCAGECGKPADDAVGP